MTEQFKFSTDQIANLNKIVLIAIAIIAIGFAIIYQMIASDNTELLKNGIREKMVVVQKYKTGKNRKFSNARYSLKIDRIFSVKKTPLYKSKDTTGMESSEKLSNKILSEVFKDKERINVKRMHKSFKILINSRSYRNIQVGSIVTLVYHKNESSKGKLLSELTN